MTHDRPAHLTKEPVALTILPYFGLVSLMVGVAMLTGVNDSAAVPVTIGGVLVLGVVLA